MGEATSQDQLETLQKDGTPPETRFANALAAQNFVRRLIQNDTKRGRKRALVAGLVDGNAPYNHRKLRESNRADAANANFGTARSYVEAAVGAFYDLTSQAPGFVQVVTSHGEDHKRVEYSRIMSEEADKIFSDDEDWDQDMQLSHGELVLYGTGPLWFEDEMAVFPVAVESGDVKVPDRTRSKLSRWEAFAVVWDYYPPELYAFIKDEAPATAVGWDVAYTQKVISNAMDIRQKDVSQSYSWEHYQNQLKSNACDYIDGTKICKVAHLYWREFPDKDQRKGRISHAIVERESGTDAAVKYLFFKKGRYADFKECISPNYFDRGRGGYHHNVTGLGVKQYAPMELENRTLCNLYDKVFAPKILFKPTSTEATQKFQMARFGDYGLLPMGTEAIQNPIQGFITDGLAMFNTSSELMRSILSPYRQPAPRDKPGNPVTKFEKQLEVSQQSSLSNTVFSRFYKQKDCEYGEIMRRMCNLNSTDDRAKMYQSRCLERGLPKECFGRVTSVKAVRVIGEGSPFMRQATLMEFQPLVGMLPENGQDNWKKDLIAAKFGQSAVSRYSPEKADNQRPDEQTVEARLQIAAAKIGVAPVVTSEQSALKFAGEFLGACVQAVTSLQQGGDPMEVLQFLNILAPAARAHIDRAMKDPVRKMVAEKLDEQWKRLAQIADKLKAKIQQMQQQRQQQSQKTQGAMTDEQIKTRKMMGEERRKDFKLKAQLARDGQKHRLQLAAGAQNMQLADAKTAAEIHRNRMKAFEE